MQPLDEHRLHEALALAQRSIGLSDPNPRVGCVIGRADGTVHGRGFTQQAGGPHAEVVALRDAAAQGAELGGATAWVSLEPCAHHGRTPPCCDALIGAGIGRVVAAIGDPFHAVAGRGFERLRAAGVVVEQASGAVAEAALELNVGFFSRMRRGRPWVRLKVACSLDGRTALPDGRSQWLTGPAARADGHAWRRRAGVVLTGIGTVLADDPRLDVRLVPTAHQPRRAVLDPDLRTPPHARLLAAPGALLYTRSTDGAAADALRRRGAELVALPPAGDRLDLAALLADLTRRQTNEVHLEGGARLNGSWLQAGLVDELVVYMAPKLLGDGAPLAVLAPLGDLQAAASFDLLDLERFGPDLRLRLRPPTAAPARWRDDRKQPRT